MYPVVSVLLLTYNHEKYIAEAIESALNQKTNFSYEILIGDDCSTDLTGKIAKEYSFKYPNKIKLINSDSNVGAIQNEKRLFEKSQGKYIAFLEGDDFWTDPFKLQKQVDFLENNPDFGLVHGNVNHLEQNTGKTTHAYNKNTFIPSGNIFENLISPNSHLIKTMTVCFRKEIIEDYFDYNMVIDKKWLLSDLPLWLTISNYSKVYYFDEVFATYRLLEESASRTKSPFKQYEFHQSVSNIKNYYLNKFSKNKILQDKQNINHNKILLRDAYNLNDISIATEAFCFLKKRNSLSYIDLFIFILIKFPIMGKLYRLIRK